MYCSFIRLCHFVFYLLILCRSNTCMRAARNKSIVLGVTAGLILIDWSRFNRFRFIVVKTAGNTLPLPKGTKHKHNVTYPSSLRDHLISHCSMFCGLLCMLHFSLLLLLYVTVLVFRSSNRFHELKIECSLVGRCSRRGKRKFYNCFKFSRLVTCN